jgi:hypothetical protein
VLDEVSAWPPNTASVWPAALARARACRSGPLERWTKAERRVLVRLRGGPFYRIEYARVIARYADVAVGRHSSKGEPWSGSVGLWTREGKDVTSGILHWRATGFALPIVSAVLFDERKATVRCADCNRVMSPTPSA